MSGRGSVRWIAVLSAAAWTVVGFDLAARAQHSVYPPSNPDFAPSLVQPVQYTPPDPIDPTQRRPNSPPASSSSPSYRMTLPEELFGNVNQVDELPENRRRLAHSPAADAVFGAESKGRVSTDVGDLLRKSISSHGVSTQDRTPITTDTRVRGQHAGQVLASGSYWTPVRADLDTMMNKIDSRLISDVIVIKGPYSSRYGPGFRFIDFELVQTQRYDGLESHGSTSFDYDSNGEQSYGRQSLWGGSTDWGYHISYGHRTGTDYRAGNGDRIPSGYKSRDLFVALGKDLSSHESIEFNYLRLDQTDLEFPGLVYDINYLVTNGYEVKYTDTDPSFANRLDVEVWYNATRFNGDTRNPGKVQRIPALPTILYSASGLDGYAITNAGGSSLGYRWEATYGLPGDIQTSVGLDLTHLRQQLNDIEPLLPDAGDNNFPIPPSNSTDFGLFLEETTPLSDVVSVTTGARFDAVITNADNIVGGVPFPISDILDADELQQEFYLWSAFLSAEVYLDDAWTLSAGVGHGQRPPTITELYTVYSFIGSLQKGLTALIGDPLLQEEKLTQVDLGLQGNFDQVRVGAHGYFCWVRDLITYDLLAPAGGAGGLGGFAQAAQFVNTDRAILAGFETYGEADLQPWLTTFGTLSYIEGRDLSRDAPSRFSAGGRSGILGRNHEPLPGITPLESRLGLRFHDPIPVPQWGLELAARVVDNQDRIAASLEEVQTPGFTTYDVRFYRRFGAWLFTSGIENLTNKYYQEHLDYRSGLGVFRPGINYYAGLEVTY
ncbi:MAG: TonB-dependent receptor [Planctomycetaceae bacterium]|nr:TonB-dependent receptor [Planctomycetaceae bacterium]